MMLRALDYAGLARQWSDFAEQSVKSIHQAQRKYLIGRMAADLRRIGATASEADAIRALSACPYRMDAVAALAGEALVEAQRFIVAAEMVARR